MRLMTVIPLVAIVTSQLVGCASSIKRDLAHYPGVAEASNLEHCKNGYFGRTGNNIVPLGPDLDFGTAP